MYDSGITRNKSLSQEKADKLSVVYVSTFPPQQCGIATFTQDITNAMDEMLAPLIKSKIVAMNPNHVLIHRYPRKVILQISHDDQEEYIQAAQKINQMDEVQLVNIQHEFGIFGGKLGSYLIPFMQALEKPMVITFHTVLPEPDEELYNIVRSLTESASAVIIMTPLSRSILLEQYAIPSKKIKVIPHGIHARPYILSKQARMTLGYSDRVVLSTFGLLSRVKGLEFVIESLPRVAKEYPDFIYLIFGATHPVVLQQEGESYRNFLIEKIYRLGLYDHVRLYNRYFPLNELLHFLKATDIYISPSLEPNQAVSGTLSYAMGMGRPVISTAFAQAREVVTDEVGILVDFGNPEAYTDAILRLLKDDELRLQLGENAYFRTRNMTWSNVALRYTKVFSEYSVELAGICDQKSFPPIKLNHLIHLTDNFGIIQFAKLSKRDTSSDYTLDDNARALLYTALYYGKLKASTVNPSKAKQKRELLKLINIYLDFIDFVAQPDGCFQNYVRADRTLDELLNKQANLEEANARAIYALAAALTTGSLSRTIRRKALDLLQRRITCGVSFESPRASALCIKAFCALVDRKTQIEGIDLDEVIRSQCDRLVGLYQAVSHVDWRWFESQFAHSNGVMPEALLLGYYTTREERYLTTGKAALDFLIKESFVDDVFMPIGQGGWRHQGKRRYYSDQQPEEVRAMVHALDAGHKITGDRKYSRMMLQAFYWFLGDNRLNQVVYDRTTGGCYDGVGRTVINLNQGAESTISYLLTRLAFD